MNLELFSCSGGMAEGFRRAGLRFDFVFDKDPDACASYAKNLGHEPVCIDVHDLLRMVRAGWRPGPVELFVADPPCTPWSRAGKRKGLADERDMLRETAELIVLLRPATYLIGNVPGLQDASSWSVVQEVIGGLARHGYCVDDYAQLDAADFGVPQHRVRPFWFGHLAGACMRWPSRTHCSPEEAREALLPGIEGLRPWVTCRDALSHLPLAELGRPVRLRWKQTDTHRATTPDEPAKTLTKNTHSDGALLLNDKHPINAPDEPSMTVCAKDRGGAQGARACTWPWDVPSTTICTDERQPPPGRNGRRRGESQRSHPNAVVLSERSAKILQGFPEAWHFAGATKRSRWSQLGMAMPPPLAEVVARAIVERLR